jgi:beta-alanine degradation protein BauB
MEENLDMVGGKVLLENDRVRIWELRLAPGERSALHEHKLDYILVQISGDRVAVEPDPRTKGAYKTYYEAPVTPGRHIYIQRGGVEVAYNCGKEPYYEIEIELKD